MEAIDERGVRITLVDWFIGLPRGWDFFAPWGEITSMLVATPVHDIKGFGESAGSWQTAMNKLDKPESAEAQS